MAQAAYRVTEDFEQAVAEYTGAPYAVAVDNCSNALKLCLEHFVVRGMTITIPAHTYMSVPCEIIKAGAKVRFLQWDDEFLKGHYHLTPTNIIDSALRFTADMYIPGKLICLSFSGPFKHLKLGKGGMILTDDQSAAKEFKKARFSGRNECSYHEDSFTSLGHNCYLLPELAAKGLRDMAQFYNRDGTKKHNEDLELPYPDLSQFKIYTQNGNSDNR